jgi:hypothetical protein
VYWNRLWQESHNEINTPTLVNVRMDTNCGKLGFTSFPPIFNFNHMALAYWMAPSYIIILPVKPTYSVTLYFFQFVVKAMSKETLALESTQHRMWFNPKSQAYMLATAAHF